MAKFTPGPAVAAVSGSVGGTVFSRNRGGAYMRNRAIPTDPNTQSQQSRRAILASQSQAWADLTDAQRASWTNWSKQNPVIDTLGSSILLSGHQSFIKINSRLDLDDETVLSLPPIVNAPLALDSIVLDADIGAGNVEIVFAASALAATVKLWILAAVVNSAGVKYVRNLYRFIGTSDAAATTPFDIETLVQDKFGTLVVGQTLHVRVGTFDTATGLLSVALEDSAVVDSSV